MDIDEAIISFFERTISDEDMQIMFNRIGNDPNLMIDFKNYWMLDYAAKKCADSFTPPSYVVNNIYSRLGYSIPPGSRTAGIGESLFAKSRILGNIMSALMGIILTLAVMLLFFYPNEDKAFGIEKSGKNMNAVNSREQIPTIVSSEIPKPSPIIKKNITAPVFNNKSVEEQNNLSAENQIEENNLSYSSIVPMQDYKPSDVNASFPSLPLNYASRVFVVRYNEPLGLSFGLGNNPSWNLLDEKIPPYNVSPFNNFCISVFYDLSDNFKIGAEARQETFYTEYYENGTKDTVFKLLQQSNLTTFGAIAKWYPYRLGPFYPYLGINAGVNLGGFILRPGVGMEFFPYNDIGFTLGMDYSYFRYQHLNNWFSNSKVGINYGVFIKF